MADPLSITTGVLALLQTTAKVTSYLRDVHEADTHKTRLLLEISAVRGILQTLNDLATNATKGDPVLRNIEGLRVPLNEYQSLLSRLEKALRPPLGLTRVGKALKWPFEKKEVLEHLATIERCKALFGLALHADHLELSRAIQEQAKELRETQRDQELRDILAWLSPLDFAAKHDAIRSRHEQGTCQWLLDSAAFKDWENATTRLLWCPGVPGAGKTVFASVVIEHLIRKFSSAGVAMLGIYCDYKDFNQQSSWKFLASLLQQLISQQGDVAEQIKSTYREHIRRQTHPNFSECLNMLTVQIHTFSRVYVVIDALDECTELNDVRRGLLEGILQMPSFVSILVTSRFIPMIGEILDEPPRLIVEAKDHDIHAHVRSRLDKEKTWARRVRLDQALAQRIGDSVVSRASGM
jgi:hypothetical protein